MGNIGKMSSFARSKIRRIKQRIWDECTRLDADLSLVLKPVDSGNHCRCVLVDPRGNIVGDAAPRIIHSSDNH